MKKIFNLIICVLMSITLVSCDKSDDEQSKCHNHFDVCPDLAPADIYEKTGQESEYGFIYGDYIWKQEVYLGPWYSRGLFEPNEIIDGMVYHAFLQPNVTFENIDLDLAAYFSEDVSFEYNNQFDYQSITDVVYVEEDVEVTNGDLVRTNYMLLVDEDKNLYYASGSFNKEYNRYMFSQIILLEPLKSTVATSGIALAETTKEISNKIIDYLPLLSDADLTNRDAFLNSEFMKKIFDKCIFNTSGNFYNIYKISDNLVLKIFEENNQIKLELSALCNGVVVELTQDIDKFESLIYCYNPEYFDEDYQPTNLLEYSSENKNDVFALKLIDNPDEVQIQFYSTPFSSIINLQVLETTEEIQELQAILENLRFVKATDFEMLSMDTRLSYTYRISYGDVFIFFRSNNVGSVQALGRTFRVIGDLSTLYAFCDEKLYN